MLDNIQPALLIDSSYEINTRKKCPSTALSSHNIKLLRPLNLRNPLHPPLTIVLFRRSPLPRHILKLILSPTCHNDPLRKIWGFKEQRRTTFPTKLTLEFSIRVKATIDIGLERGFAGSYCQVGAGVPVVGHEG